MDRIIDRTWALRPGSARVTVETRDLFDGTNRHRRGTIHHLPSAGLFSTWRITDFEGVDHGTVTGDYLDAEQVLLGATVALDELVPADELTDLRLKESTP